MSSYANSTHPGFLLILLSSPLYTPPTSLTTTPNPPLFTLTHTLERRLVLSLLCSFLNTSLTRDPADTTGPGGSSGGLAGIVGGLGKLGSLGGLGLRAGEERKTLVRLCMSVLLVALDYKMEGGAGAGHETVTGGGPVMGEGKEENAFRYFLSKLVRIPFFSPPPCWPPADRKKFSTAKKTLHSSSMVFSPSLLNTMLPSPTAIYPAAWA